MLYTLTLRDGSTLDVEAPEGASKEEIAQAASQQQRRKRTDTTREKAKSQRAAYEAMFDRPEELGIFGNLRTGFGAGFVDIGESATLGALSVLDEENELAARERVQGFAESLRPDRGDPNDLSYKIGQTFGSIAGIAVPAAAAVYAGAPALAGTGIAALLGTAAGAGEASERARAADATEEERNIATRYGALIGSTEAFPLTRIFKRLSNDLGEEVVEGIGNRIKRAARTGGEEAAQEAAANILQNLNERGYNADQAILEGSGEAAGLGGFAGSTIQLLVDAVVGGRRSGRTPPPEGDTTPVDPTLPPPEERLALPAPPLDPRDEMAVTSEGQALTREQRIAAEEQRAQERAREREGLRAAEIGDVEAFEQPDLFALEREQDRRRLGTTPVKVEEPLRAPATVRERDLVDRAQEEADLADQIAAIEAEDAAKEKLRAESDLETIAGQQDTKRRKATESRRNKILQDTIKKTPSRNYNRVGRAFSDALQKQGITNTQPTEAELQTIQRAVNIQRAERPAPPESKPITAPPEATQLKEMEARIPEEGTQRAPTQPALPGFGRKQDLGQAPAPAVEPTPAANTITTEMLDQMGISAKSPIRQRVIGKDLNDPTARKILSSFATKPRTSQAAELGISRTLEDVSPDQPDLFTPQRRQPVPQQDAGRLTGRDLAKDIADKARDPKRREAAEKKAADLEKAQDDAIAEGKKRDKEIRKEFEAELGKDETDLLLGPDKDEGGRKRRGTGTKDTSDTKAPKRRGLGARDKVVDDAATPTSDKRPSLKRPVLPVLEKRKTTKALAPERPKTQTTTRTGTTKAGVEARLLDAYDANTSADHKRFVKSMSVEAVSDPMTVEDKESVLKLVNTKSNKQNKNTIGAAKKYLGAYEDPILGLQDAIDDVVSGTTNFRAAGDMTVTEVAFFGPDGSRYLPARGKNSAQATLDWAADNLSPQTKRWMQTAIRDAKVMNTNVAAFQSTDLVAKRRELETLFKDGFDINNEADALALEKVMDKLGITESDPMLRSMMYKGSMFNLDPSTTSTPLSNVVKSLLRGGDLQGALRAIAATTSDPEVRAVAEKLAKVAGTLGTKVKIVKMIDAMEGVTGRFTETDNTIQLAEFAGFKDGDQVNGLNVQILLHEMTHAATVATLQKKNHPLTRKLQKIFDETKEHMPTAYGFTNLKEFVAEAFTNPEFQRMLAGLKVEGDPLTPFAKIKAAISNFLRTLIGKKPAPVESALDQTTSIIDNILAPQPNQTGNGEFFMLSPTAAGKRVADIIGGVQKSIKPVTPKFAQEFADKTMEFVKSDKKLRALIGFYPSQAVADVAERSGITGAMDLHKLMEEQRGAVNKSDQEVEAVLKNVTDWEKKNKGQVDALNRVVYTSTIEQVDPSKPVSAYRDNPEKIKAWKSMRADWRALSNTGGDKIYAQMRDTYKKQYQKMKDVIFGKIDETIADETARKKLKNEVYSRLFETGTIEPYFPLTRSGDYWLSYDAEGQFNVEAFETLAERDRAINDLKADKTVTNVNKFVNISKAPYAKAPPNSFVQQTLQTLRANKVDDNVQAEIMRMFIEALPETSFAKSLQRRKGTPGYKEDAINALRTKAYDLGRQVERLRYSAKIRDLQDKIIENNAANLTDKNKYIVDELQARADFARNPPPDGIAQAANRAAFVWTIGFNASSAIVNLSQVPMFVYPMLAGKYGYGATGRAIKNASKLVTSSGFNRKSDMVAPYGDEKNIKVRSMPSLDNYFELDANGDYVLRKDIDLDDAVRTELLEAKPLIEMMAARGQLNRSLFADNLGVDSSGRKRSVVETVSAASAFMFHNVEVYNRQVTALTAYQLELNRLKEAEPTLSTAERQQKAAVQALYDTQQTNGGAVLETAPRFGQKGVGRVALMYKTYGIQMYYTMFKTVRDGIDAHHAGDKAARNEAFRQFAGVTGASFLLAGVVGMPLAREVMQLLNLFRDEEEDDIETVVRKAIGEGFYKGPLTEALGVDLSSRIGLSGLILQANRFNHDASLEETVFHYLGGPAWSTITRFKRAYKDVMQGEMQRGVEALLPGGVSNVYKSVFRYGDEGILTRRKDPIMDDLSMGQLAAQAIGFAPAEYTRTQEMNQQTKRIERSVNNMRTKLLRKYYIATRTGDYDGRRALMAKIRAFNKRHPTARIGIDTILKSMRQHIETSATMYNGITISPNMRRALEESRSEWDQGWQLF